MPPTYVLNFRLNRRTQIALVPHYGRTLYLQRGRKDYSVSLLEFKTRSNKLYHV